MFMKPNPLKVDLHIKIYVKPWTNNLDRNGAKEKQKRRNGEEQKDNAKPSDNAHAMRMLRRRLKNPVALVVNAAHKKTPDLATSSKSQKRDERKHPKRQEGTSEEHDDVKQFMTMKCLENKTT